MSLKTRGQEVTLRVIVDGVQQDGSFFKVNDFSETPRTDLVEHEYLGETETDIDIQHHGYDLKFSLDNTESKPLEFMQTLADREANHQVPQNVTIIAIFAYREPGARDKVITYHNVFVKVGEQSFSGRKENVKTSFEAKCKKRDLSNA